MVSIANEFHNVWTAATLLRIPEAQALRFHISVNEPSDRRTKGFLLVTSDPDEIPVRRLDACRQRRTKAGTCADTYTALVERRSVGNSGELELSGPDVSRRVVYQRTSEVSLNTTDQVVVFRVSTLRDDTERMILYAE